ncbi:hypothetical protein EDD85DRAFT_1024487 [Armillaria nabsnona]|nr:hypothetical protein EDD85DRAFT_1024487 [Armillaria nabsnona]
MIDNPPAPRDYLRIPPNLTPEWGIFFEKLAVFCENSCGSVNGIPNNTHERVAWEKRQWIMDDENLDEFDMWLTATNTKEKGNEALRNVNQPCQARKSTLPQSKGPFSSRKIQRRADINLALELQPGETAILALKDERTQLLDIVVSAASLKRYLDQQPQPPAKISRSQTLNKAGQLIEGWQYDKLSKDSPLRRAPPPMY